MQRSNSNPLFQQHYTHQTNHARLPVSHNTSSAFSASANPNEDWTKISDLAERRRIQNRIAQRNYRKKLKRRLEDLERKADSATASPEPSHAEAAVPSSYKHDEVSSNRGTVARQTSRASRASTTRSQEHSPSPELFALDDPFANFTLQEQQSQFLSPPSYTYSAAVPSSDYFTQDVSFIGAPQIPQIYAEQRFQPDFMHSLPPTLPSMTQLESMKQDPYAMDDNMLNPFGISYASLAGINVAGHHVPVEYVPMSPPSSDEWSSISSRENSPPVFMQPMTPLSRSTSPNIQLFDQYWQS